MARQASWTAPPAISVSRDAELDPADPIPFIRLIVPDNGRVARVTLTWGER